MKAQASLRVRAVSPEPSLFADMKYESRRMVRPKIRHLAAHARFKNEFTEDEKCQNLMSWLKYCIKMICMIPIYRKIQHLISSMIMLWDG